MNVLFVDSSNAGPSQLAAALHAQQGGSARSAGLRPAAEVATAVVEALAEVYTSITSPPRRLEPADLEWADLVVRISCAEECRLPPGKQVLDWNLPDPVGLCLEEVRELRAVIAGRVSRLR